MRMLKAPPLIYHDFNILVLQCRSAKVPCIEYVRRFVYENELIPEEFYGKLLDVLVLTACMCLFYNGASVPMKSTINRTINTK